MVSEGRADRSGRLIESRSGAWGSSSADFMHVVRLLFEHSRHYAATSDGNRSPYTLAAIPMLLSSLRCLVVEFASLLPSDRLTLGILDSTNDFSKLLERYDIQDPLRSDALLLQELRHEIIHPAHRPTGTRDNWPNYLRELKHRGLLQSSGHPDVDYIFFEQLQSHRLFAWSWRITRDLVQKVLETDPNRMRMLGQLLLNYDLPLPESRLARPAEPE
jgi:hypothetical protein